MTHQSYDSIYYNGKEYYFYSTIFNEFLDSTRQCPKFLPTSTANYSGIKEAYVVKGSKLYLKYFLGNLDGDLPKKKFEFLDYEEEDYNVDKTFFFPDEKIKEGLVFCDWFCGALEIAHYKSLGKVEESYFLVIDYGVVIETKKFTGEITEGLNLEACIYDYHRYEEPSENSDGLYKYEYSLIVRLSKYDYILEDKSKEDLLLLARDFNTYKDSLEGKSYYEKKNIFNSELNRLKRDAKEGKPYLNWEFVGSDECYPGIKEYGEEWGSFSERLQKLNKNKFLDKYGYLLKDKSESEINLLFYHESEFESFKNNITDKEIVDFINTKLPIFQQEQDKRNNETRKNEKIKELELKADNLKLFLFCAIITIASLYAEKCGI
jgi:hypothetical protein